MPEGRDRSKGVTWDELDPNLTWDGIDPHVTYDDMRIQYSDLGPSVTVDGATIPSSFTAKLSTLDGLVLRAQVTYWESTWRVSGLSIDRYPPRFITAADRERLASSWLDDQLTYFISNLRGTENIDRRAFAERTHARLRRRWITPELLQEVAEVYKNGGRTPAKAVAEHFSVAAATANRWIKQARTDGFMPERGAS